MIKHHSNINWKKKVKKESFSWISSNLFWRLNEMKLEELLFDVLQMWDKHTLRILVSNLWLQEVLNKIYLFSEDFDYSPFELRYLHLRNYLIFLKNKKTMYPNWLSKKELEIQTEFCWELNKEYLKDIPININKTYLKNKVN